MSDSVIRVESLYKQYQLGTLGYSTLQQDFQSWWARIRGKEDPSLRVGDLRHADACKTHGRFWALKDISFNVEKGEVVGIVGRNGAGKSTLLKILCRVTAPTKGCAKIRGRVASLLEIGTGFHPELTGRENVYINGAIHGMSREEINKKYDDIVNFAGIEKYMDTPVKRYSSGMYTRLAFAVAAHLDPEILLVDEVLAVGDAEFQRKCIGKMEQVSHEGRTVLFVSHNVNAIKRLCNRAILLDGGQILLDGPVEKVVSRYVNRGMAQSGFYEQEPDLRKDITLKKVMILKADGELSPQIPYNEPFKIQIHYLLNRPVKNCTVAISVDTADLIRVFDSCDYDTDLGLLSARAPGSYVASVTIPAKWLNMGRYRIVVNIVSNNSPMTVYEHTDTITFDILEIGSLDAAVLISNNRRGILQPVLMWETKKEELHCPITESQTVQDAVGSSRPKPLLSEGA